MSAGRNERFTERWEALAVDVTLPLAPEATIGAHTLARARAFDETLAADSGATDSGATDQTLAASLATSGGETTQDEVIASESLPRISLGGRFTGPASSSVSGDPPDLEIRRTLGEGGMGKVHEAHQRSLRRHVAVKTLKDGATEEGRRALLSEARVTGFLEHPGIIPVHSLGLDESGKPVLVMKRVQGVPWSELLDRDDHPAWEHWLAREGDRLLAHLAILSEVCDAVHFAHNQGIVHRDIKPENVMLGEFGEVYLVDWGLAVRDSQEAVGQLVGTPAFMAPEMAMGESVDARTDVYLLGATLHQILTGAFLHSGSGLRELLWAATTSARFDYPETVPAELAALADSATRPDAGERPQSAEHVRQAISHYLGHRNSIVMSDAAGERLAKSEALYDTNDLAPEELAFHLGTLCAEARFGFEQALDAWPENSQAKTGLHRCLELLVEAHILRHDPVGASAQLGGMDNPPEALREKIAALQEQLDLDREERERLDRIKNDLDQRQGQSARFWAYLLICVFVCGISLYFLVAGRASDLRNSDTVAVAVAFVCLGFLVAYFMRRRLLVNAFSRRIVSLVLVGLLALLVNRSIGWKLGLPVQHVFLADLVLLATVAGVGGVAVTGWMLAMSPVFLAGAATIVFSSPAIAPTLFSISAAIALLVGGLAWFRFNARSASAMKNASETSKPL